MASSQEDVLRRLAERIREIEDNARPQGQTRAPLDIPGLSDLLPDGRLPAGSLVELLSAAQGAGAWTLALLIGLRAYSERKVLVVADGQRAFYPPAAAKLGLDLKRTLVIRPPSPKASLRALGVTRGARRLAPRLGAHSEFFLEALVRSLRSPAVGAVIGRIERLTEVDGRRLQLAAETGGGIGFLLRPASALRTPSFAAVRLLVAAVATGESGRRIRVEAARLRGGKAGQAVILEIDDETGDVHQVPALAAATTVPRSTRASG